MPDDSILLNELLIKANQLLDQCRDLQHQHSFDLNSTSAMRWHKEHGVIPVQWRQSANQTDLLFVDKQRALLRNNTLQFVRGFPANNALLWGSRGTGKSSLLQAVINEFLKEGLKIIEITREDLSSWAAMSEWISAQEYKFIIYCDDLSFDRDDSSYKSVKAALDGSLSSLPENALMYSTSNRRHLLPEYLSDNKNTQHVDDEIHHSEAVEEAISLSDRFGLWLSFHPMNQDQYLALVNHWLKHFDIDEKEIKYREEALRWALQRGSRSGRIANQFARYYAGKIKISD